MVSRRGWSALYKTKRKDGAAPRKRPKQREWAEQVIVVGELARAGYLHCSIPNEGKRSPAVARMLKSAGLSPGAPDLLVFDVPPGAPEFVGAAIQMKQPGAPTTVPENQEAWLIALAARGWATQVCWSAPEALAWLASLGYRIPEPASRRPLPRR